MVCRLLEGRNGVSVGVSRWQKSCAAMRFYLALVERIVKILGSDISAERVFGVFSCAYREFEPLCMTFALAA